MPALSAQERRRQISARLCRAGNPVSAAALAQEFSVSRQIIVGDVALLRASGADITATPRGYLLGHAGTGLVRTAACSHTPEDMGRELYAIVDAGCEVLDVIVEHPVYGQLAGACAPGATWTNFSAAWRNTGPVPCPPSPAASTCTPSAVPTRKRAKMR